MIERLILTVLLVFGGFFLALYGSDNQGRCVKGLDALLLYVFFAALPPKAASPPGARTGSR
jgi:hypothetical protein